MIRWYLGCLKGYLGGAGYQMPQTYLKMILAAYSVNDTTGVRSHFEGPRWSGWVLT